MRDPKDESSNSPRSDEGAFAASFLRLFDQDETPAPTYTSLCEGPWEVRPTADGKWGCYSEGESEPEMVLDQDYRYLALLFAATLPISADYGAGLKTERMSEGRRFALLHNGLEVGRMDTVSDELLATVDGLTRLLCRPRSLAHLLEAAGAPILARTGRILLQRVVALVKR